MPSSFALIRSLFCLEYLKTDLGRDYFYPCLVDEEEVVRCYSWALSPNLAESKASLVMRLNHFTQSIAAVHVLNVIELEGNLGHLITDSN